MIKDIFLNELSNNLFFLLNENLTNNRLTENCITNAMVAKRKVKRK